MPRTIKIVRPTNGTKPVRPSHYVPTKRPGILPIVRPTNGTKPVRPSHYVPTKRPGILPIVRPTELVINLFEFFGKKRKRRK